MKSNFRKAIPPLGTIGWSLGPVFIYPKFFQFTSPNLQNVQNLSEALENHLPAGTSNQQRATRNEQRAASNRYLSCLSFLLVFFPPMV